MRTAAQLTFTQWTAAVKADLEKSGFEVTDHRGFPFVPALHDFIKTVKLFKVRISVPVSIKLYQEGALFVPAGADRILDQEEEAKGCAS